ADPLEPGLLRADRERKHQAGEDEEAQQVERIGLAPQREREVATQRPQERREVLHLVRTPSRRLHAVLQPFHGQPSASVRARPPSGAASTGRWVATTAAPPRARCARSSPSSIAAPASSSDA